MTSVCTPDALEELDVSLGNDGAMSQQVRGRTMHIGEVAERTGLSLRTLRHDDEVGLLSSSPARSARQMS